MGTPRRNEIHDISSNHHAQQPFVPQSFIQKMTAFFTQTKVMYVPPDVKVTQEGKILHVLVSRDSEGKSTIEITIPSNGNLKHFTKTQDITELKVMFGNIVSRPENHKNTQNRMLSQYSDLELGNQPRFTKKDYLSNPTSKIPLRLDNTLSETGNDFSNDDQSNENKTLYHRGFPVELVSYSTKKFSLSGNSSLLESVTFTKENKSRKRETLVLFRVKGMLYSASALRHLDKKSIESTNSIDILSISETESDVRLEVLTGLSIYTAFQVAKLLEFPKNGRRVRKLKDLITCLKLGNKKNDDPDFLESVTTANEDKIKACYSPNQDENGTQNQTGKVEDSKETIAENIRNLQQELKETQQDIYFNTGSTKDQNIGKHANTKYFTHSKWTDCTQMGNIKIRPQSERPSWKIFFQNREDETDRVVSESLGEPIISQAIYEFFGQHVDSGYKSSIERSHEPWPSMHPFLPYKCRYLDNKGS
ncbi:uncharacterized protein LOC143047339 [Mytilus galloprovincialis]|uniref:uncharacterized protein LOC143047339 n=1 Tax=Mytilus galloprovincialis TaxID=29158 RepID=UPI003F7C47C2